jgi:23S rRNA (cytidine1920-2'-O)/16S rRNA (cytidine1409-2'-O)-methyltransferase
VPTRTKAQALIMAGQVKVKDAIVTKVGTLLGEHTKVQLISGPKYVSRGGEKLEGALEDFALSPEGKVCMDVGASTGGFTDCMLQRGAKRVYAIDVGTAQLDSSLIKHPQVISIEKTHILTIQSGQLDPIPDFVTIDVSFISLKNILAHIRSLVPRGAIVLPMVKPQFEVGAKYLKKGVVRSEEVQHRAVADLIAHAESAGFECLGQSPSRLKGPKGNQEYFLNLRAK